MSAFVIPSKCKTLTESIESLKKIQKSLEIKLNEAENRFKPLIKIRKETEERCLQYLNISHFNRCTKLFVIFLRIWLGNKDEITILLNGQIVRSYHGSFHQIFLHDREEESHYYHSDCSLSTCSIDGLDYEFRQVEKKYKKKSVIFYFSSYIPQFLLTFYLYF